MNAIRERTAKVLKEQFGIDEKTTDLLFAKGILTEQACRNMLIKEEYRQKDVYGERQRAKASIAEKYYVSVKLVEKVLSQ